MFPSRTRIPWDVTRRRPFPLVGPHHVYLFEFGQQSGLFLLTGNVHDGPTMLCRTQGVSNETGECGFGISNGRGAGVQRRWLLEAAEGRDFEASGDGQSSHVIGVHQVCAMLHQQLDDSHVASCSSEVRRGQPVLNAEHHHQRNAQR